MSGSDPKRDLGESVEANNPADEVSGATGTRCGVPVEGFPSGDSVAHSPRVSSLRTAENRDEERVAAEADVKPSRASGPCGGSKAEAQSSADNQVPKEGPGPGSPSETGADAGAVDDLSSGEEDTQWVSPRNLMGDLPACPLTIDEDSLRCDLPLNAISWRDESHPQWVRVRSVMDSGAAQSVAPPSMAPGVVIAESPGSQRGQHYVSASGGRLPNMGQQKLRAQTNEGREGTVLYQIAEISRPLTAVSQTCDNGNWVVYTPQGLSLIHI